MSHFVCANFTCVAETKLIKIKNIPYSSLFHHLALTFYHLALTFCTYRTVYFLLI